MDAEHLGHGSHHVLPLAAAPQQGAVPELLDESVEQARRAVEKLCGDSEINRVTADDECFENLQMPTVEAVQGPLNAGTGACPSGQRGQVAGRRTSEVGSTANQRAELLVIAASDVVGEAPDGGGWS